jgi:hypothetical protein
MIFLIYTALHSIFFLLFYSIILMHMSIFYYCLIELKKIINKFSKHNWVNVSYFEIKYLDLLIFLDFSSFIFIYHL